MERSSECSAVGDVADDETPVATQRRDGGVAPAQFRSSIFSAHALCRFYIGIADGMSIARIWACRYSNDRLGVGVPVLKMTASERRSF